MGYNLLLIGLHNWENIIIFFVWEKKEKKIIASPIFLCPHFNKNIISNLFAAMEAFKAEYQILSGYDESRYVAMQSSNNMPIMKCVNAFICVVLQLLIF